MFEDAKIGELVHHEQFGDGKITDIFHEDKFPIRVTFEQHFGSFTYDGRLYIGHP